MPEQPGAGRLDPETLAAYMDGQLPPEERARVDAEIAADPETYEWMVNTLEAVDDDAIVETGGQAPPVPMPSPVPAPGPTPRPPLPFHRRRSVQTAVGTLLAAAAALVMVVRTQPVWWQGLWGPAVDPRFAKLVEAVGEERYIEARLTGGFKYGPLRQVMRGPGDLSSQNLQLLAAAGELQKAAEMEPTAENLHAWGVAQLLLADFDAAVTTLQRRELAATPEAQSDLSAALAGRAEVFDKAEDWPLALAAAEQALAGAPRSREAMFNRALALQRMHLYGQARVAWEEYLASAEDPAWRAAAQRLIDDVPASQQGRVRDLEAPLVGVATAGSPGPEQAARELTDIDAAWARELLDENILPALATTGPDAGTRRALSESAMALGHAIRRASDDGLMLDAVEEVLGAHGQRRDALARAWAFWRDGRRAYAANRIADMNARFKDAEGEFRRSASVMVPWATHYRVVGEFYLGRLDEAEQLGQAALSEARRLSFPALEARLLWDLGTIRYQRASFEDALFHYERARDLFRAAHERENEIAITQLIAEAFGRLGDGAASWTHHLKALSGLPGVRDARRRHTILAAAGHSALNLNMPHAGWHLFDAAARQARDVASPVHLAEALLNRARASAAVDRPTASDLVEAADAVSRIDDAALQRRFMGDLLMARAEADVRSKSPSAVAASRAALEHAASLGSEYRAAALHLLAGRAAANAGLVGEALAQFRRGVETLESKRAVVRQRELRVSFLDSVFDLYAELVKTELSRSDHEAALNWFERSRARSLLDELSPEAAPLDVRAMQARLAPHQGILFVQSVGSDVFSWLLLPDQVHFVRHSIAGESLPELISTWRTELESGRQTNGSQARVLVDRAIAAVLQGATTRLQQLAIVPDEVFEPVSFAAVKDAEGVYLAQRFELVVSPSGTLAVQARSRRGRPQSVTILAEPSMAPSMVRLLGPLSAVGTEVAGIVASYQSSTVRRHSEVTEGAFLRGLHTSDVVHFSGHAIADPNLGWRARLLLADGPGAGILPLAGLDVASVRARLVLLAACDTGLGRVQRGEGLSSLARPLLRIGVPHVAVSKWRVQDQAVAVLSQRLHRIFGQGHASVPAALRAAQMQLMSLSDGSALPSTWASLEIQGGLASEAPTGEEQ